MILLLGEGISLQVTFRKAVFSQPWRFLWFGIFVSLLLHPFFMDPYDVLHYLYYKKRSRFLHSLSYEVLFMVGVLFL